MDQRSSLPYSQDSVFSYLSCSDAHVPAIRKDTSDVQRETCCVKVQENPCTLTAVSYHADVGS